MDILLIGAGSVGIGLAASVASQGTKVSIYAREKTAKALKVSKDTFKKYIREGKLSEVNGKIPIMSIARLLCG